MLDSGDISILSKPPQVRRGPPVVAAGTHLTGRCTNDLFCVAAIEKIEVRVPTGGAFVCASCHKPLTALPGQHRAVGGRGEPLPLLADGGFLRGRCLNHRRCDIARQQSLICVRLGNVFVCPECSKPLSTGPGARQRPWLKPLAAGIGAMLGLVATSVAVVAMQSHARQTSTLAVAEFVRASLVAPAPLEVSLRHGHARRPAKSHDAHPRPAD